MELENLKEYLDIVLDMEKDVYAQTSAIAKLREECENLGKAKTIFPPAEFTKKPPELPVMREAKFGAGNIAKTAGIAYFFLPAAPFYVMGKKRSIAKDTQAENERKQARYDAELASYEEAKQEHQQSVARYEQALASDRARVETELVRKQAIGKTIETLEKELAQAKANLQTIYDENVVFPKYRNLTMVASIYEYLCAGRCTDLPAAYNILEQEMLMNRIIIGIESVVERLEEIKQGQYMIYQAVVDGNRRTSELLSFAHGMADQMQAQTAQIGLLGAQMGAQMSAQTDALREIGQSAQMSAYHAEQIEKQTRYMARMDYLTGRNDAVLFNLPPT